MSYLVCEKCGNYYQLDEGKSSFNFDKCECGGKLKYSQSIKEDHHIKPAETSNKIKLMGVIIGFIFLFISLTASVILLFGSNMANINVNTLSNSSKDLTIFVIVTVILTVFSGSISSYISRSGRYSEAAINGGLVGVILGLILGMVGGLLVLLSGILFFGFLSMLGGVFSSFLRK